MQLGRERVEGFPCLFWKWTKSTLILENISLSVCIYGLNSRFKCSFKNILVKKTRKFFPAESFLCMSCMKFFRKIPGSTSVTFNLSFHPNYHPNILVFANLPIYRKLIHDNISLVFWKSRIFYSVLFWRWYKILFAHINLCIIEILVGAIL